jgi:hypothetical protein
MIWFINTFTITLTHNHFTTAHNQWLRLAPFWLDYDCFLFCSDWLGSGSLITSWFSLLRLLSELRMDYEWITSESEFYVTTDGPSASLYWTKAPILGLRPDFFITVREFQVCWCGVLSLTRGRVWVPWDSWPYFTVSDPRLPFPSSPTTRKVTVEVFDPDPTRDMKSLLTREWSDPTCRNLPWFFFHCKSIHNKIHCQNFSC